eukprot:jgi/Hompol1/5090/HPOL_000486-RA
MDDIEPHKENLQPLRGGRSAAALAGLAVSSTGSSSKQLPPPSGTTAEPSGHSHTQTQQQRQAQLEAQRAAMEAALGLEAGTNSDGSSSSSSSSNSISNSADPLEPHFAYIKWIEQHLSPQHAAYLQALESTLRRFKRDQRYKNDVRYLQLWMRVAKRSRSPIDIFKYLSVNEIGMAVALYYEEYAALLETLGKFDEASQILKLGIERGAQPLERLARISGELQRRIEARASQGLSSASADEIADQDSRAHASEPLRNALQTVTARTEPSRAPQMAGGIHSEPSRLPAKSNGQFKVFADDDSADQQPIQTKLLPTAASSNPWPDYDGDSQRRKENEPERTKWTGVSLPQRSAPGRSTTAASASSVPKKIQVYCDDEPKKVEAEPSKKSTVAPTAAAAKSGSRMVWRPDLLFPDGIELSVEQTRAALPRYCYRSDPMLAKKQQQQQDEEQDDGDDMDIADDSQMQIDTPPHIGASVNPADSPARIRPAAQHRMSQQEIKPRQISSPTINTKAALVDIFEMFSAPLAAEEPIEDNLFVPRTGEQTAAPTIWEDEDETISGKVYRPPTSSVKIGVFRDENADAMDQGRAVASTQSTQSRTTQMFHDENDSSHISQKQAFSQKQSEMLPPTIPVSTTAAESVASTSRTRTIVGRHLDPMTPITEVGSEFERTMSGISSRDLTGISGTITTIHEEVDDTMAAYRRDSASLLDSEDITETGKRGLLQSSRTASVLAGLEHMTSPSTSRDVASVHVAGLLTGQDAFDSFCQSVVDNHEQHSDVLDQDLVTQRTMEFTNGTEGGDDKDECDLKDQYDEDEDCEDEDVADPVFEPLSISQPCNPFDLQIREMILDRADATHRVRRFHANHAPIIDLHEEPCHLIPVAKDTKSKHLDMEVDLEDLGIFNLVARLGSGTFGHVYLAREAPTADLIADLLRDDGDDDDNSADADAAASSRKPSGPRMMALKVTTPSSRWEHHILTQLSMRLPIDVQRSVVRSHGLLMYADSSCMGLDYCKYGSILDCLNHAAMSSYSADSGGINEALAVFWTIELLRTVRELHAAGFVHGDIKADNVMLRFDVSDDEQDPEALKPLQAQYRSDGAGGWKSKGIVLIDWGQAIDLSAFQPSQTFVTADAAVLARIASTESTLPTAQAKIDSSIPRRDAAFECQEVQKGLAWRFEPDWYGIASVIHVMLYHADMETVESESEISPSGTRLKRISLKRALKRNWQRDLWHDLFEVLLNSGAYGANESRDCIEAIDRLRVLFEQWLEKASVRGSTMLRGLLSSAQAVAMKRR